MATALALTGCVDLLDVPHYRDARTPTVDVIVTTDVSITNDAGPGTDARDESSTDGAVDAGSDVVLDATHDVAIDAFNDVVVMDASTDVGFEVDTHDVPIVPIDVVAFADVSESGSTCAPVTYACPSPAMTTCLALTTLQANVVSSVVSAPCCADTDCVLISTDRCCGGNAAVRLGPIADCLQTIGTAINSLCLPTVCPGILCTEHHPACVSGACIVAVGAAP